MTNSLDGNRNGSGNYICGQAHPTKSGVVCSLTSGHRTDEHRAYQEHKTTYRTCLFSSWGSAKRSKKSASNDDVAAAMASIKATMQSRLPPEVVAARIAETNTALAEKYDGTGVSVQIHVDTDVKVELDAIIERLTLLRASLA